MPHGGIENVPISFVYEKGKWTPLSAKYLRILSCHLNEDGFPLCPLLSCGKIISFHSGELNLSDEF